jgi:anti-anti-sigma regulatory factor
MPRTRNAAAGEPQLASSAPDPGVFVLHLEGAGDGATQRFRYDLSAALEDRVPLIVDLTDATALEPGVMALLVESIAVCEEQERPCVLLVPEACPPRVRERFEGSELMSLLPVVRSWDEALRRARPQAA